MRPEPSDSGQKSRHEPPGGGEPADRLQKDPENQVTASVPDQPPEVLDDSANADDPTDALLMTPSVTMMVQALRKLITASDRYRTMSAAALGLNVTDTYALSNLGLLGPLTQTELAARVGITRGASTVMIDRLEAADLAKRTPHPTDRRVTVVELTTSARNLLVAGAVRLASTLPDVDQAEAEQATHLLESIANRLDELTENPTSGWPGPTGQPPYPPPPASAAPAPER